MKRKASKESASTQPKDSEHSTKDTSYSFSDRSYEREVKRLCEAVWFSGRLRNPLKPAKWDSTHSLHLYVGTAPGYEGLVK